MALNFIPKLIYNSITLSFTYPPEGDPFNEVVKTSAKVTYSSSGVQQTQFYFNEEIIKVKFKLLTKTQLDALRTFYKDWGSRGKTFDYYPHASEVTFYTYTLNKFSFDVDRISPKTTDFLYQVTMEMRRVL